MHEAGEKPTNLLQTSASLMIPFPKSITVVQTYVSRRHARVSVEPRHGVVEVEERAVHVVDKAQ